MRHVVDTPQVAHLWANRSQGDARNSQGNFYFEGDTIYSYGGHFPVGRMIDARRKGRVALITTKGYSDTTSGHISMAWSAVPDGVRVFHVPDLLHLTDGGHAANWKSYIERISKVALKAKRARTAKDWHLSHLSGLITEANAYAAFFGLRQRIKAAGDAAEQMEQFAKERERIEKAEKARKAREAKEYARRLAVAIEEWKAGTRAYISAGAGTVYLRVAGDEVQTSLGARFPLKHAKLAFRVIKACRAGSKPWERNGKTIHLGGFQVDSIDESGNVKAGCHRVEWAEIERIARQVGLIQESPDNPA